jgi:hypothetical protein
MTKTAVGGFDDDDIRKLLLLVSGLGLLGLVPNKWAKLAGLGLVILGFYE